jgi:site-specific DNA-methyltransferase (adenine-specific)
MNIELWKGDCLELMKNISDNSIDMILCDLPYGTTVCKWDSLVDLDKLWFEYKRIIKPYKPIVMFGSQPFTTKLISSNYEWFKYCWVWKKNRATGHVHAKNRPMKLHEDICVQKKGCHTTHKV